MGPSAGMLGYWAFAAVVALLCGTMFALRFNVQRKSEVLTVLQGLGLRVVATLISLIVILAIPFLFIVS